jgi:hypothetical protein
MVATTFLLPSCCQFHFLCYSGAVPLCLDVATRDNAFCIFCNREFSSYHDVWRHWPRAQEREDIHEDEWRTDYRLKTVELESILLEIGWIWDLDMILQYYMGFLGYENIYDFYWDWYMGVNVSTAEDLDEFWSPY